MRGSGRGIAASPGFFLKKTRLKQTLCPKEGSHSNLPGFTPVRLCLNQWSRLDKSRLISSLAET